MRRLVTMLTLSALFACGIGVVGEGPGDGGDGGKTGIPDGSVPVSDVVFPSDGAADAAFSKCQSVCQSGNCDFDGTCLITCSEASKCNQTVRCPDGIPCRVTCTSGGCENIDCGKASKCEVKCTGSQNGSACHEVHCQGDGRDGAPLLTESCVVDCEGHEACDNIYVRAKTAHVTCNGADDACENVICGDGQCTLDGSDKPGTKCCHSTVCNGMKPDPGNCF